MANHQTCNNDVTGYQLHPDVVWIARPDGSARLMHMSANVCSIDADSAALLTSIIEAGPERSASELAERYSIGEAEAREQVQDFITELREQKLIRTFQPRTSSREKARDGAVRALVPGVIRLLDLVTRNPNRKVRGLLWTARWAVAQFGWATAVRAWERIYPQPAAGAPTSVDRLEVIDHTVRQAASRSLIRLECKERSLVCLALARESGIPAQLIVGVAHDPMQGHVWVEAGGRVIGDDPEHCRSFEPVARYG
jgi:Transglutaminase-like superfamily